MEFNIQNLLTNISYQKESKISVVVPSLSTLAIDEPKESDPSTSPMDESNISAVDGEFESIKIRITIGSKISVVKITVVVNEAVET